ncbi:PRC-barrel domain-containing protein [Rhizobium sp. FY34]|uniref:PRC-barrel domain-containing protein n=1 Tax=Rhizobium sp. FY34 TaxID=2562309 RepID=UPI0010C13163|nr:PRC-barrel domain-containing protein [Rhizobium sp. FY34]
MKKTLSTMAAAAVLMASSAIAPALAQTSTTPVAPSAQTNTTTPAGAAGSSSMGTRAAGMTGAYLTQQAATQISANDYIGKAIYNGENNSIGNVTDLIIEENGGIVAAVVGVGGFLGMGEKNVAVPMDKLNVTREDDNDIRLTTMETAASLKAAPEFLMLDDQDDAVQSNGTTTAPARP